MLGSDGLFINRVYDAPIRRIAVMGERSSGTNVSKFVLERAFRLEKDGKLGWKHGFVQGSGIAKDTLVVVSVRAPYDWVISMFDKPWHCTETMRNLEFPGFIRAPWDTVVDRPKAYFGLPRKEYASVPLLQDRDPMTGRRFSNLMQMRTAKLRHWTGLRHDLCNLVVWRFESFKKTPEDIIRAVSRSFDLDVDKVEWPVRALGSMRPDLRQGKIQKVEAQDMRFINSQLDPALEKSLGYQLQEPGGQSF